MQGFVDFTEMHTKKLYFAQQPINMRIEVFPGNTIQLFQRTKVIGIALFMLAAL